MRGGHLVTDTVDYGRLRLHMHCSKGSSIRRRLQYADTWWCAVCGYVDLRFCCLRIRLRIQVVSMRLPARVGESDCAGMRLGRAAMVHGGNNAPKAGETAT